MTAEDDLRKLIEEEWEPKPEWKLQKVPGGLPEPEKFEPTVMDFFEQPIQGMNRTYQSLADLMRGSLESYQQNPYVWGLLNVPAQTMKNYGADELAESYTKRLISGMDQAGGALESADDLIRRWGEASERPIPKGVNPLADRLYTLGEWSAPMGLPKKADAMVGLGATVGEQAYGEAGELIGGLTPLALTLRSKGRLNPAKIELIEPGNKKQASLYEDIAEWLGTQFHDRAAALRNIESSPNTVGDLADVTKDLGAANVVGGVPGGSRLDAALQELEDFRSAQREEDILKALPGDPAAAVEEGRKRYLDKATQNRLNAEIQQLNLEEQTTRLRDELPTAPETVGREMGGAEGRTVLDSVERQLREEQRLGLPQAIEAAEQAKQSVEPIATMAQTGEMVTESYKELRQHLRDTFELPKWQEWEQSGEIHEVKEIYEFIEDELAKYPAGEIDATMTMQPFVTLKRLADEGVARPQDLSHVASQIKSLTSDQALPSTHKAALATASNVIDELLMATSGTYKEAKQATVRMRELLGGDLVSNAQSKQRLEGIMRNIFTQNEAGELGARALLTSLESGNTQVVKWAEEYILARAAREGLNDDFLYKYEDFLNAWAEDRPDFVSRLKDVVSKEGDVAAKRQVLKAVEQAEFGKRDEALSKWRSTKEANIKQAQQRTAKGFQKSQLSQYLKEDTRADTVRKALTAPSDATFARLAQSFRTEEGKRGFAQEVAQVLKDMASRPGGIQGEISANKLIDRVRTHFGDEGIAQLEKVLQEEAWERIKSRAGSARYKPAEITSMKRDMIETMSAILGMKLTGANPLIVGAALRRAVRRALPVLDTAAQARFIEKAMTEFLTNPEALAKELRRQDLERGLGNWLVRVAEAAGPAGIRANAATTDED